MTKYLFRFMLFGSIVVGGVSLLYLEVENEIKAYPMTLGPFRLVPPYGILKKGEIVSFYGPTGYHLQARNECDRPAVFRNAIMIQEHVQLTTGGHPIYFVACSSL